MSEHELPTDRPIHSNKRPYTKW